MKAKKGNVYNIIIHNNHTLKVFHILKTLYNLIFCCCVSDFWTFLTAERRGNNDQNRTTIIESDSVRHSFVSYKWHYNPYRQFNPVRQFNPDRSITAELSSTVRAGRGFGSGLVVVVVKIVQVIFPMIPEPNLWADMRERDRSFDEVRTRQNFKTLLT